MPLPYFGGIWMRVLLQFNGKKKGFTYRNPKLTVPELTWRKPGDVIECDSQDAALLTVGGDFKIVGGPPELEPIVVEEPKPVEEPEKKRPGRPKVIQDDGGLK